MKTERELLDALLARYWAGGVTQEDAAQLLEMRKAEFAELADLREVEAALQREAWRYYVRSFNTAFPWCDAAAVRRGTTATKAPAMNTHKEPTRREMELLTPPQRRTLDEIVPSPRKPDEEVARYLRAHPIPLFRMIPDVVESGTEIEECQ